MTLVAGAHRTKVLWGKSPLQPDVVEASTERKLANLQDLGERYPGLAGLARVDITLEEVVLEDATTVSRTTDPGTGAR